MTNPVIERAMRAAFDAWKTEVVQRGQVTMIDARFERIGVKDRALIELQCRAAIASLKEPNQDIEIKGAMMMPDYDPGTDDARLCFNTMIDAALKDD